MLSAFTAKTAQNLQLNAGVLAIGIKDPKTFDGTLTDQQKLGATSGGGNFTAIPEVRNLFEDLDGARGSYVDGNVIDNWEIKLTVTLKEMTAENFKLAMMASDIAKATTSEKFDTITARNEIKVTDYLENICWLGTKQGSAEPIIIELKNVLNVSGINFSYADKDKGGLELELKAHFKVDKPDEVPFTIYTPKAATE